MPDDIDLLCGAIGGADLRFDLNGNQQVNEQDVSFLLNQVLRVPIGDANLDGRFDSSDLVQIFAAGQYEDSVDANSGWATGDWTCDHEFNTSDLVAAFQAGAYAPNATAAATATTSSGGPTLTLLSNIAGSLHDQATSHAETDGKTTAIPRFDREDRPLRPLAMDDHIFESGRHDWLEPESLSDVHPASIDEIFGAENLDAVTERGYGTL